MSAARLVSVLFMAMRLELDPEIRGAMFEEFDADRSAERFHRSGRLTDEGVARWPTLLREAAARYDDAWLASALLTDRLIRREEVSHRRGVPYRKRVPHDAHETLAEGEFNRLYMRGLCVVVLRLGGQYVQVFRARTSRSPRSTSLAMEGRLLDAGQLLNDLRSSVGVDTAWGLPPGPNSGLSARHPEREWDGSQG